MARILQAARTVTWRQSLDVVMRQKYGAGEKLFVDSTGGTVTVWEPGGEREAQLFVAALEASSDTYAEAVRTGSGELDDGAWAAAGVVSRLSVHPASRQR